MAEFEKKKHAQDEFNKGNKYVVNDGVQPATINNLVENSLYTEAFVRALADTPDVSNANAVGTPKVTLIDNTGNSQGITGAKKFKFEFLKGQTGATPNFSIGTITIGTDSQSASVTITGTPENPVLNFTLPPGRSISNITSRQSTSTSTQTTTPITVHYDNGESSTFNVVSARGQQGNPVWVRYAADSSGSGMTATPSSATKFIGFYVGSAASTAASDYTWSRYVGKSPSNVSIGVTAGGNPTPQFIIEWDDGSADTTIPIDRTECVGATPVTNVVSSVNGLSGTVDIGNISTIFESNKTTVKNATNATAVSSRIGTQLISNIFETDGKTTKLATKASRIETQAISVAQIGVNTQITLSSSIDFLRDDCIFVFQEESGGSVLNNFIGRVSGVYTVDGDVMTIGVRSIFCVPPSVNEDVHDCSFTYNATTRELTYRSRNKYTQSSTGFNRDNSTTDTLVQILVKRGES